MIETIRTLFTYNQDIFVFLYGQTFLVLGLAIALQSRHSSRLELARSLSWLAAFGFTHGLHELGDLFIPIQRTYLAEPAVELLNAIQILLLAISFTFLFEFGIVLLRPFHRSPWLRGLSTGVLITWTLVTFFYLLPIAPDYSAWHHAANALARYLIGFPGGLLAAVGLREQALRRIAPLNVPHITRTLRISGLSLGLYAIIGGLIPPPVWFFPGNLLNSRTFEQVIGIPPLIFRSLTGLVLTITIVRAMEIFDVETERLIEAMEQGQILAAERERIARDLHDGVIQKVYTAGLLLGSLQTRIDPNNSLNTELERVQTVLDDSIADLRKNLRELHGDTAGVSLSTGLELLVNDPRFSSLVDISLNMNPPLVINLSPSRSDHILAIVNEALSNIVRHAHATQVTIDVRTVDQQLEVVIRDDGIGLSTGHQAGYGLRNMRDRARLLGGRLDISPATGKGTAVSLLVPWMEEI